MTEGAPDGFSRTILYGYYEGAAVALACDEQGRLILKILDTSPWDPEGTILLADSFDDGLIHGVARGWGTGAEVATYGDEAFGGPFSCKMVGGSDADQRASLIYWPQVSNYNKVGVEVSIRLGSEFDYLFLSIYGVLNSVYFNGIVTYQRDADKWIWEDAGGGSDTDLVLDAGYVVGAHNWYRVKFVVDLATGAGVRFKHPGGEVDLSALSMYRVAQVAVNSVAVSLQLYSRTGENDWVLWDSVVITQDES